MERKQIMVYSVVNGVGSWETHPAYLTAECKWDDDVKLIIDAKTNKIIFKEGGYREKLRPIVGGGEH